MKVCIVLGSKSDIAVGKKAKNILDEFGVSNDLFIASAHRTPEKIDEIVANNYDVYIAVAGLSAHLPGVVSSKTIAPVIGVPLDAKLGGLDSLLSIVQMPPGIPTAAVGIDNGANAALLAVEILAVSNDELKQKLGDYRQKMKEDVEKSNKEI